MKLLTSPDEQRRRAFAAHVLATAIPQVRALIIDRLVAMATTADDTTWARAASSLAEMAPAAFSAVKVRLLRTRTPRLQVRLAELLARMGPQLPAPLRFDLAVTLELALLRVRGAAAREAFVRALSPPGPSGGEPAPARDQEQRPSDRPLAAGGDGR
jgi:hypothetical protein